MGFRSGLSLGWVPVLLTPVGAAAVVAGVMVAPAEAQEPATCLVDIVFGEVGEHEFVVPDGLGEIELNVYGAQGGNLPAAQNPGTGGLGAGVTGVVLPVTPGETLGVFVGGKAGDVGGPTNSPETPGGFNGGGDGGVMVGSVHGGAGGGGASDIRRGDDRLVVAGGGGGGSHGGSGGAGGQIGQDGQRGPTASGNAVPGGGASQTAGGAGGTGDGSGSGQDGAQFQGGAGGGGTTSVDAGGGGGGGWFGGGGGGGGTATVQGGGSGGGGGASFSTEDAAFQTGIREGDGLVEIGYTEPECTDLSITKSPSEEVVNVGETVDYTLVVTNEGPGDATGVAVTDDLPAEVRYVSDTCGGMDVPPWTWEVGALGVGETVECVITVEALATGTIVNTSTVAGDQRDPTPENNSDDAEFVVPEADLSIAKTASVAEVPGSDPIEYLIEYDLVVENLGPDGATGVTVTDDLPAEVSYVSDTCGGTDVPPWTWGIGALAAGGSIACTITVRTDLTEGTIENTSVVDGDQEDPTPENNEDDTTIGLPPVDLSITKTPSEDVVNVGETVDYTLVVTNNGPVEATASGVMVTDELPDQVEYRSDTCGGSDVPPWTWEIGVLGVGEMAECTVTVEVVASGSIVNTSAVEGDQTDPTPENNSDDAIVEVPEVVETEQPTLAMTGTKLGSLVGIAAAALLGGGGLFYAGKRRRIRPA